MFFKVLFAVSMAFLLQAQTAPHRVKYGDNPNAASTFLHDGVKLYYETYGTGEPLLLVHGNGGRIADFVAQIDYFRKHYRVIAMDSRDQGKSADSQGAINYERMTDDLAALLDHLHSPPVNVLGWSDGGIEALLLGIRHPAKVKKIVSMAANTTPSGLHPDILAVIRSTVEKMTAAEKATPAGKREYKLNEMMLREPHITARQLAAIAAPTLVLAGDHDAIRDEDTLAIYHAIPNSQLCIFPNATHMVPYDDSALFNSTVERFLRTPFVKKDRVKDLFQSLEEMKRAAE